MRPAPSVLDVINRRLPLPRNHGGLIGTERVLASVRLVLALSSLLLIWVDPGQARPYRIAAAFLTLYCAHALALLVVMYTRREITPSASLLVHAADTLWPAVISLFGSGAASPFFLYFIFALLAAAFRWGMRETALTTVAVVFTMAPDAVVIARTPLGTAIGQHVDVVHFVMRAVYLVIFAFLIGYVAES